MVYYLNGLPVPSSDELYHWGILGMKWGIRRFRNKDGTLTDAGKARYAESSGRKDAKDMGDKELQSAVNRLRNEQAYRDLVKDLSKKTVSSGASAVGKVLGTIGSVAVKPFVSAMMKQLGTGAGKGIVNSLGSRANDDDDDD